MTVSDQRVSFGDNMRLMSALLFQLVEMDWCLGYELTREQQILLDDIREKASELLKDHDVRNGLDRTVLDRNGAVVTQGAFNMMMNRMDRFENNLRNALEALNAIADWHRMDHEQTPAEELQSSYDAAIEKVMDVVPSR